MNWPAIASERLSWRTSTASIGLAATSNERVSERYDAAVPPFIAELHPEPSPDIAQLAEAATIELSRFDAELGHRVSAFAPVLLRSESAASSQIENLTASARQILTAELGARASSNAQQITANTRAMSAALQLADDLSAATIREMHRVLLEQQPRHTPGEWRDEPVWIGSDQTSPIGALFVAPRHERIPTLIDDLVAFARRRDIPAVTAIAVTHAQFETIHPFSDGNGRTGRALAQAMLRYRDVTRNVAVPVSAGLLAHVDGYHQALTGYRAGDIDPIILALSSAALRAVENSRTLVADIDRIRESWNTRLSARRNSGAWRLLDVIARRPVIDARSAATALGVQVPNAYPPLRKLVEAGILQSKTEHEFGPVWRSVEVLDAVDAFARRAGRRQHAG